MTGAGGGRWLVAGTTTAVRSGRDLPSTAHAIADAGFSHIAVADADPDTIPAARTALDCGVPSLVVFISPTVSWTLGQPPDPSEAYPPARIQTKLEHILSVLDRPTADVVLAHKWDPAWEPGACDVLDHLTNLGLATTTGVSCPDSHPGAAVGGRTVVCASWNVHDQGLAAQVPAYRANGATLLARSPLDHGALTGLWIRTPPSADNWRARWWGPQLDEAVRRGAVLATTAAALGLDAAEAAFRFTLRHHWPDGTLIGVSNPAQAEEIRRWWSAGPLALAAQAQLAKHAWHDRYG